MLCRDAAAPRHPVRRLMQRKRIERQPSPNGGIGRALFGLFKACEIASDAPEAGEFDGGGRPIRGAGGRDSRRRDRPRVRRQVAADRRRGRDRRGRRPGHCRRNSGSSGRASRAGDCTRADDGREARRQGRGPQEDRSRSPSGKGRSAVCSTFSGGSATAGRRCPRTRRAGPFTASRRHSRRRPGRRNCSRPASR